MVAIEKRIGNMIYIIKSPQFTHKRHLNPIRKRQSDDADSGPPEEIEVMDVIYDTFDMPIPQVAMEQLRLKRKKELTDFIVVNPKRKGYWDSSRKPSSNTSVKSPRNNNNNNNNNTFRFT